MQAPNPACPVLQCLGVSAATTQGAEEGAPKDVLSRHCLTLAALMDSVILKGPLSTDRQSGRRWQVKNTLLAKRLRWGPCHENGSDERPLEQEPKLLDPQLPFRLQFEFALVIGKGLCRRSGGEGRRGGMINYASFIRSEQPYIGSPGPPPSHPDVRASLVCQQASGGGGRKWGGIAQADSFYSSHIILPRKKNQVPDGRN
jgi:hypothetical protein